jgi:hypothetical protein
MRLKWQRGQTSFNGIASHLTYRSKCGLYAVVRSKIPFGGEKGYRACWYAVCLDPVEHLIGERHRQRSGAAKACAEHALARTPNLFKNRKRAR